MRTLHVVLAMKGSGHIVEKLREKSKSDINKIITTGHSVWKGAVGQLSQ